MTPVLEVQDLTITLPVAGGRRPVVEGASFTVGQGETLGLVGESGCGKSMTLLSLVALQSPNAIIDPRSSVRFNGRELVGLKRRQLEDVRGNGIGFIFQDPMTALNPVYKVSYQIEQVLRRHTTLGRDQRSKRVDELLESVGFRDPARVSTSYPHALSGGMRQRVVIAMAMAAEPALILADEPTTALDVTTQAEILMLLRDLQRNHGVGVILVSHDLGLVGEFADRLCIMYAGRIVESGSAAAVLSAPMHPYGEALLRSAPSLGTDRAAPLPVIPGNMPPVAERGAGCQFADRCDFATERCSAAPAMKLRGGDRAVACWLHDQLNDVEVAG